MNYELAKLILHVLVVLVMWKLFGGIGTIAGFLIICLPYIVKGE